MTPRNNPGNIRFSFSIKWRGQTGQQGGFVVYDTLNNGARALCMDLKNAQVIHHLNSVASIVEHYAPPNENDTAAYITAVCADMHVSENQPLQLSNSDALSALAGAVWHHEQGQRADVTALSYGVASALGTA